MDIQIAGSTDTTVSHTSMAHFFGARGEISECIGQTAVLCHRQCEKRTPWSVQMCLLHDGQLSALFVLPHGTSSSAAARSLAELEEKAACRHAQVLACQRHLMPDGQRPTTLASQGLSTCH